MSSHRVLLIELPAELAVQDGRIRVRRNGRDDAFILPEDIAVLVLHHHTIRLSNSVLQAITCAGGMILVTGENHLPSGILWPWAGCSVLVRRLRQQIALDGTGKQKELWGALVKSRILTQAMNLRLIRRKGALRLERISQKVMPGDSKNHEAEASRHYWKHLFPSGVNREKQGSTEPINIRLNYGFAVLRALVARTVVAAGLNPALGLGHHSQDNPFNLADDLMEPYRYLVERRVFMGDVEAPFDSNARVTLLEFISDEVEMAGRVFRLPTAIGETVDSLTRILNGGEGCLSAPGLLCQRTHGG